MESASSQSACSEESSSVPPIATALTKAESGATIPSSELLTLLVLYGLKVKRDKRLAHVNICVQRQAGTAKWLLAVHRVYEHTTMKEVIEWIVRWERDPDGRAAYMGILP